MGIVAMDAARLVHDRSVDPVLAECLTDHRAVALAAELEPFLLGHKGRW